MKRKITYGAVGLFSAALILTAFSSGPGGSGNAVSGAPGEGTCVNCHAGNALNSGAGSVSVSIGAGVTTYTPGNSYTVTVTGTGSTAQRYGFQTIALKSSDNSAAGSFTAGTGTKVSNVSSKDYVEHSSASNSGSWTFTWQAPATDVGEVKFYIAGNSAEDPFGTGGDNIYTNTLTLTAAVGTATADVESPDSELNVYPNPGSNNVNVSFYSVQSDVITANVQDLTGKVVKQLAAGKTVDAGLNSLVFNVADLANGNYVVTVQGQKGTQSSQLVVSK